MSRSCIPPICPLLLIISGLVITGCSSDNTGAGTTPGGASSGRGSSSSSSSSTSSSSSGIIGDEVSQLDWELLAQTGLWQSEVNWSSETTPILHEDGNLYATTRSGRARSTFIHTMERLSSTEAKWTNCTDRQENMLTQQEHLLRTDPLDLIQFGDAQTWCRSDEGEVRYFVDSERRFSVDAYCEQEHVLRIDISKLSSEPRFDLGEVSLAFDQLPDLATSDGVCAQYSEGSYQLDIEGEAIKPVAGETITTSAPYGDSHLVVELSASAMSEDDLAQAFTEGSTHSLSPAGAEVGQGQVRVHLELRSPEFTSAGRGSDVLAAQSGSVTIVEKDERVARARFQFDSVDGEHVEGEFFYDLR